MKKKLETSGLLTRRELLKVAGTIGVALTVPTWFCDNKVYADGMKYGAIVDARNCVNCKSCQITCKVWNENQPDPTTYKKDFTPNTWTYVSEKELGTFPDVNFISAKRQCMHCAEPKCVSSCPMNGLAMHKEPDGPVLLTQKSCIKCRSCIRACPYGVPQFDEDANEVKKCVFCVERLRAGDEPVCVGTCPANALRVGTIDEINVYARAALNEGYPVYGIDRTSWVYVFPKGVNPDEMIGSDT